MSLFASLFGHKPAHQTTLLEVTGRSSTFTAFTGDPYSTDIFRAGVDAIARIAAKFVLQPTITFTDGTKANADDRLTRILQVEPNPLMSAYDLLYQLTTHLFVTNNSFAYLQREGGQIVAVWPLHVTSCELAQGGDGRTVCALTFANGRTAVLDYADVIHLRRHFNAGDVMGDANDAITAAVRLAEAQNAGIENSIRTAGSLRGIVKFSGALGESKLAAYKRAFEESQLRPENTGGVVVVDQAIEYTPLVEHNATINADDVAETRRKVYDYLGITEAIVSSSFNDDGFGAFDESVIEALALQYGLEATRKVYTPAQVARGRRIECSTSRVRYIGTANKTRIIEKATPMGVLSINETRDLLGLAPIEGGDRFIQSLNYADTALVNRYQLYSTGHGVRAMEGTDDEQD